MLPADFDEEEFLVINHVLDRGSIGVSLIAYMAFKVFCWTGFWGIFHDLWNTEKNAAKSSIVAKFGDLSCGSRVPC